MTDYGGDDDDYCVLYAVMCAEENIAYDNFFTAMHATYTSKLVCPFIWSRWLSPILAVA